MRPPVQLLRMPHPSECKQGKARWDLFFQFPKTSDDGFHLGSWQNQMQKVRDLRVEQVHVGVRSQSSQPMQNDETALCPGHVHGIAVQGSPFTVQELTNELRRLQPSLSVIRAAYFSLGASGCGSAIVHVIGTHTTGSATVSTQSPGTLLRCILSALPTLLRHVATSRGSWPCAVPAN